MQRGESLYVWTGAERAVSRLDRGSSQHNMLQGWIDMQRLARAGAGVASSEYSEKPHTCMQPSEQGTRA